MMETIVRIFNASMKQIEQMDEFILSSELELTKKEYTEVSDFSMYVDEIFSFTFDNEEDALLFRLRFAGSDRNG